MIRKVALIIFYDKNNKILLQDRRKISKVGEEWGFFGGGIEEGETAKETVVRETKEELNYNLEDYELLGNFLMKASKEFTVDATVFIAEFPGFDKIEQREGLAMKSFSIKDAKKLKMVGK